MLAYGLYPFPTGSKSIECLVWRHLSAAKNNPAVNIIDNYTGQNFLTGTLWHVGIVQEGSSVGDGATRPTYCSGPNPMPGSVSG